jgi:hypothetical protein
MKRTMMTYYGAVAQNVFQCLWVFTFVVLHTEQIMLVSGFTLPLQSCQRCTLLLRNSFAVVVPKMAASPQQERRREVCDDNSSAFTRRKLFFQATVPTAGTSIVATLLLGMEPTCASTTTSLLDEFYYGTTTNDASATSTSTTFASSKKGEEGIDPTLRANYYYPTAKKRYLPRIQLVSNEISSITKSMLDGDVGVINWDAASKFADTTAENAILPLKLYESSLRGQGLSMSNAYAKSMKADAAVFEQKTRELQRAVRDRSVDAALSALTAMNLALTDYRKSGRLMDDIEEIPSVDDIRRMTMRKPTVAVPFK